MRTHIDWLTFTIPMLYMGAGSDAYADAIASGLLDMFGEELRASAFGGTWQKQERSRAPYTDAWTNGEGVTLFASPNLTHACIEISGQGCENLISAGDELRNVLRGCKDRVTRIDIACDIETETTPLTFVKELSHERMRTNGHIVSGTGETCYVGSQKSERYARVYRYNAPHPRSHLLRVEHVFRKDYAKKVASQIVDASLASVATAAGLSFGWKHPDWQTKESEGADISVVHERGNTGSTVFWLVHSVAPAFRRLCADGTITDPQAFIEQFFLDNKDA